MQKKPHPQQCRMVVLLADSLYQGSDHGYAIGFAGCQQPAKQHIQGLTSDQLLLFLHLVHATKAFKNTRGFDAMSEFRGDCRCSLQQLSTDLCTQASPRLADATALAPAKRPGAAQKPVHPP